MGRSVSSRKIVSFTLGSILIVLFAAFAALNAFSLKFLNPATTGEIVVFTGLSALAFLLFVTVLLLLVRNVLKLYADQRSRVMGTRLRTRMLWGAVLVSLVPIIFMALFSYGLMNRAVDRWFSQPVTEMRDDSNRMALQLAQYTSANARAEAESIAVSLAVSESISQGARGDQSGPDLDAINRLLRQHEITLQNGFAIVYSEGRSVAAFQMPQAAGAPVEAKPWLPDTTPEEEDSGPAANLSGHRPGDTVPIGGPTDTAILTLAQRSDQPVFSLGDKDFALGAAALKQGGTVVVGLPMPYGIAAAMTRLHNATDLYWSVYRSRRQVRNLYMMLLLLMTTLALFACSWLALNLSKQVTKPVEALADAMQAIAAGDYAHRVAESSTEELGDLVRSFNRMAGELEDSRHAVESSTLQLSAANATLEARSSELETMLETIPNGVATLDTSRRIVLTNRALTEMLDPGGQTPFIGSSIDTIFPAEAMETLDHLLQRSHRMGSASGEMEMTLAGNGAQSGGTMVLLATVALLETGSGSRTHPSRIRPGAGKRHRAAARAEAVRMARGRPSRRPRDQEPAHAHLALRRTNPPAYRPSGRNARHSARRVALHCRHPPLQRGHQLGGRFHALAGQPVLLARPVSHRRAASRRSQPHRGELARPLCRPPASHPPHPAPRAQSPPGPGRPGGHQARPRQPHRQRRRGHAAQPAARAPHHHRAAAQRYGRAHRQ